MKKCIRNVLALVFALGIVLSTIAPAAAAQARYTGISSLASLLSISSSGWAACNAVVYNNGDYDVSVKMELQQDGTTIKTWTFDAKIYVNSVEEYYYVVSGHEYQLKVTATVKDGPASYTYPAYSTVVEY